MKRIRVRFAPSPTGGLHLGGVRTALFNYLFAKKNDGDFILRIEDTDQSRYVEGAEQYLTDCLNWCGLQWDEGPDKGGAYGPYRQSERKDLYRKYAEHLVQSGYAYYAFDTPEEIEQLRKKLKEEGQSNLQYGFQVRDRMKNSLSLSQAETDALLKANTPYVIRIKINPHEIISFEDMIRGHVHMDTTGIDDKVLLKADGMPTYHLAVVVDDYLMKISHAFRGEEWLPSAPVHILLWQYLGWENEMPQWAHLPLILKPDGNGKLSKRDGERLGFPVFAMQWKDPATGDILKGFKELGFLPEAFINMLAMLGWNDGTGKEIFSMPELINAFSVERIHSSGAKFDYEKAKWFNHEWIKKFPATNYITEIKKIFIEQGIDAADDAKLEKVLSLVKDRCTLLTDFAHQSSFFFKSPDTIDFSSVKSKWEEKKNLFFIEVIRNYELLNNWQHDDLEKDFKEIAAANQIKAGEVLSAFRVMLVGGKYGPGVFDIATVLGKEETIKRIQHGLSLLSNHA